jgi:hypothetical protein
MSLSSACPGARRWVFGFFEALGRRWYAKEANEAEKLNHPHPLPVGIVIDVLRPVAARWARLGRTTLAVDLIG